MRADTGRTTQAPVDTETAPSATSFAHKLQHPRYRGRFAPSPTGPLHAGSLVAALASWLDARAHDGLWLIRSEDLDPPREVAGCAQQIIATLSRFGLHSDEPVLWQSKRHEHYEAALADLARRGRAYRCTCSRREVDEAAGRNGWGDGVYRGRCRTGCDATRAAWSWRLRVDAPAPLTFVDRAAGATTQDLVREVGDFVLRRSDGFWAYQLAVVVDDAAQSITDIVRGSDLLDNTARQIYLQHALHLPTPRYLHVPIVRNSTGQKLSKQTGARAVRAEDALAELERAWQHLGFTPLGAATAPAFLRQAIPLWQQRWLRAGALHADTIGAGHATVPGATTSRLTAATIAANRTNGPADRADGAANASPAREPPDG